MLLCQSVVYIIVSDANALVSKAAGAARALLETCCTSPFHNNGSGVLYIPSALSTISSIGGGQSIQSTILCGGRVVERGRQQRYILSLRTTRIGHVVNG